jgi:hypothetical protein
MINKSIFPVIFSLLFYGSSNAFDKFDVQVCEAQSNESDKVRCYSGLGLNVSCKEQEVSNQLSCFRKSVEDVVSENIGSSLSQRQLSSNNRNDFFGQPQQLCSALANVGLKTTGWKASRSMPGEWLCMTNLVPFGLVGPFGMENNIAYYVNGTSSGRANDIRIKINVNNSSQSKQAFDRFETATLSLFTSISEEIPNELKQAISHQTPTSFSTNFGRVELIHEPGRIDSYKVVLTDAKYLAQRNQLRTGAASVFESCKNVTARAVGYSVSNISGDGDPIQNSDHKSFMLKGRGKDLFFCEVYPGNKYKIKAALNGKFPFKDIANGSF